MIHLLLFIIYLAFISLGLPDALLGAAWPHIYETFGVEVSASGVVFMIISLGTVFSSLMSDRVTRKAGTGLVTFLSVLTTAIALFGFSTCTRFSMLCLWAVPYGLGAGSVDAALNNYVALHYASRHMSWLHCMWGVGASIGPYTMSLALTNGLGWRGGYRIVGFLQAALVLALLVSLPLWKKVAAIRQEKNPTEVAAVMGEREANDAIDRPMSLLQTVRLRGVAFAMLSFCCYCAIEQTFGLWASSYLVLARGVDAARATAFASFFFLGITIGRGLSGFLTFALSDAKMVRLGQTIILAGILLILLPLGETAALGGLVVAGLGCAPVYPSLIHATPDRFGADHSQAVIGIQMASAYVGTSLMPPLFGLISRRLGVALFPVFLLILLVVMFFAHETLCRQTN